MNEQKKKLKLVSNGHALGIQPNVWKNALSQAKPDPVVHIRHAAIGGNADYRIHVAAILQKVGCHFHAHGNEDYAIVSGHGTLHWGKVVPSSNGPNVVWEKPVDVDTGDSFVIPEGYAHQLAKHGEEDLIILFGCPDAHLDDSIDRTILPNAPTLET